MKLSMDLAPGSALCTFVPQMAPGLRNAPPAFIPPTVTPLYPGELPEVRPEDVESEPRSASPPQPPSRGLLSTETTLEEDEVSAVTAEETAATFVAGAALPAVAESAGRGTTTAATTTEEPSRSVVAIVADGTDKETEKDPSSATDTIAAIGVAPGGDEEEEGRSNTTRSASAVAVGEEAAEAVSTAQANAEAEAISVMDDSRMQAQVLLAENARLVEELASARNRLEELQSEKQEVDIEAAAAVLAAAPVVDTNAVETTAAAAATAVTPAVTAGTTTATTTTGTESLMLLRGESAPDDLGAATATGIAVPVENVVSAATAVASEIQKDGSKYPGSDRRRSTWSSSTTSSRRPPSEKKQLAAYRSGLWMLVKLVNQLATTAPGAGAGVTVGVSARGMFCGDDVQRVMNSRKVDTNRDRGGGGYCPPSHFLFTLILPKGRGRGDGVASVLIEPLYLIDINICRERELYIYFPNFLWHIFSRRGCCARVWSICRQFFSVQGEKRNDLVHSIDIILLSVCTVNVCGLV